MAGCALTMDSLSICWVVLFCGITYGRLVLAHPSCLLVVFLGKASPSVSFSPMEFFFLEEGCLLMGGALSGRHPLWKVPPNWSLHFITYTPLGEMSLVVGSPL